MADACSFSGYDPTQENIRETWDHLQYLQNCLLVKQLNELNFGILVSFSMIGCETTTIKRLVRVSRPFRQVDRIAWTPLDSACITRPRCIFDEGVTSTALEFTILTRLLHFSPVLASFPSDLVVHVGTVSHLYMAPNSVFLLNSIIFLMSQSMQPSVWSQV